MRSTTNACWTSALVALGLTSLPGVANAELRLEYGGRLQSNVRFRIEDVEAGNFYDKRLFEKGVARNEHILKFRGAATTERFAGIIDVDFVWLNFQRDVGTFEDLSRREAVEATRFEAHSAYIEGLDLFIDGLDLRIGQQIVAWGVGDGFNPTNNLNADDVEDRLLYGIQQANLMGRLSYTYETAFTLEAVVVPVFRPALLPNTAEIALGLVDRLPMLDPDTRYRLSAENTYARQDPDIRAATRVSDIDVQTPKPSYENIQFGVRLATTIGEHDVALSYYQGFSDIPLPIQNFTVQVNEQICETDEEINCVNSTLDTTTTLSYPRIKVIGLNAAGEIDPLGWISDVFNTIGYRVEVGFYIPERRRIRLFQDDLSVGPVALEAGEYDYNGIRAEGIGEAPLVLDSTPYAKWVVGLDYTLNEYLYLNLQWVHGLVEEVGAGDWITEGYTVRESSSVPSLVESETVQSCAFFNSFDGADDTTDPERCAQETLRPRIGDYLVLGLDFIFDSTRGLLRLFTIVDLTPTIRERWSSVLERRVRETLSPFSKEGFSMVLFPELNYNFGSGFELGAGALVFLGRDYTKFGDPAAGGSIIWTRGRLSF